MGHFGRISDTAPRRPRLRGGNDSLGGAPPARAVSLPVPARDRVVHG